MAKKNKKDKEAKKARTEAKNKKNQLKANAKNDKLSQKKKLFEDNDLEDDVDIDTILANFKLEQENYELINTEVVQKPKLRINPCFITDPTHSKKELILFGGETTNSETNSTTFYNDLLTFNVQNNIWKRFTSQNSPMPRSSAAMATHPSGIAILHGGEFSSPKQSSFYHYNDTWILDINTKEWSKIDLRVAPSARSGHRITFWKNYFVLFGGFRDLGHSTTYLNDLWIFDISNYKWKQIEFPKNQSVPDSRSGHSFLSTDDGILLWGGYCKVKANKGLQKGKILNDCWLLKMKTDLNSIRWEKRRKQGFQPSPRVGCSMTFHKNRGVLFGGVYDFEETEESLDSIFYNDLFTYNIETNRWFNVNLKKNLNNDSNKFKKSSNNNISKEQEKELQDLLNKILEKNNLNDENDENDDDINELENSEENSDDDEIESSKFDITKLTQLPHPRFNASTTVFGDTLYIYGGVWEYGEKDYTIDSFYSINLNKLDGVSMYWENLENIEFAKKSGDQDSDDDDDDYDDEDDDDGEEDIKDEKLVAEDDEEEEEIEEEPEMEIPDLRPWLPHPKPFESLREFYLREGPAFLEWAISNNRHVRGKHLKHKSFELCQDRWWERRDQIQIEEDKLEQLGVTGDIVERDTSKPTAKRR